jgi:hypothetical protein
MRWSSGQRYRTSNAETTMPFFYSSSWPRFLQVSRVVLVASMVLAIFQVPAHAQGKEHPVKHPTLYRTIQVDGLSIFYREAGPKDAPTLLLLHGLPSSSRMFDPPSPSFPIAITLSCRITPASDTATGQTRKSSRTRSITSPKP